MIPFPNPNSFIAGLSYLLTFVATLRAGSRAKYLFQNGGVLGQVDGPLLLPDSVLWEAAFSFESVVSFALDDISTNEIIPLYEDNVSLLQTSRSNERKITSIRNRISSRSEGFFLNAKAKLKEVLFQDELDTEASFYSLSPYVNYQDLSLKTSVPSEENEYIEDRNDVIMNSRHETTTKSHEHSSILLETSSIVQNKKKTRRLNDIPSFFGSSKSKFVLAVSNPLKKLNSLPTVDWKQTWNKQFHIKSKTKRIDAIHDYSPEKREKLDFSKNKSKVIPIPTIVDENKNDRKDPIQKQKAAEITAYAPKTFAKLRTHFGIKEDDFLESMTGPYVSFQSNSKGAARSGGFFFFSRDGAYLVKTVKRGEADKLLEILPRYYRYMKRNSRRSLLTRFFGMYQVRVGEKYSSIDEKSDEKFEVNKDQDYVFIVMNSVFPAEGSKFISERYDLKGSTVGRECSIEERERKGSDAVLKDLNLANEVKSTKKANSYGFNVGATNKASLLYQLRKDVGLLIECGVMDYSLLVGVVDMESEGNSSPYIFDGSSLRVDPNQKNITKAFRRLLSSIYAPLRIATAPPRYLANQCISLGEKTLSTILTLPLPYYGAGFSVVDGGGLSVIHGTRMGRRAIYYLGVIDFLQPWTTKKFLEREMKGVLGYDTKAISCVDPKYYAQRFLDFMDAHLS